MKRKNIYAGPKSLVYGVVAFLDLDGFKNCMEVMGWVRWTPNAITGFLTQQLLKFIREFHAVHIWGINEKEGTEEAILIFYHDFEIIIELLENLRKRIKTLARKLKAPTSLSIGVARGRIFDNKPIKHHRKRDFSKDPIRYLAYKALKEAKKKGGNCIIVY